MLQLKNIIKTYSVGDIKQQALKGISINFRENEFVSILGQSGSGKTTMLNIIGGLDRYTSGDLLINGVSTKDYKDADWDYYRNNSIGFIFQSYNLIPHQTVLSNVEMALTLAGVSKAERQKRAIEVLNKVGLGNHLHKKPNQMSGGQMQRVAIARALINNPDILLADEPTGALDSETSIQIMELLKEIAKDKLVIMVTHNPELAEKYSTRIVQLKDGIITNDTNPYNQTNQIIEKKKNKKISMSFLTALSLSFNNLRTKKGRTFLTSFAGSIGIIGVALILAVSSGMNTYISDIQKETMSSYPITINDETVDMNSLMNQNRNNIEKKKNTSKKKSKGIHADYSDLENIESKSVVKNNLTDFKKYLENNSDIKQYLGENGIHYSYDVNFNIFSYNQDQVLVDSNFDVDQLSSLDTTTSKQSTSSGILSSLTQTSSNSNATHFSELMSGNKDQVINSVIKDNYDLLYGNWPSSYDEVVLILDENNSIPINTLYQLGLINSDEYLSAKNKISEGKSADAINLDYKNVCQHRFYLVPACDQYKKNSDGTYTKIEDQNTLISNALSLKISGIIRLSNNSESNSINTTVGYTSLLTDYIIDYSNKSEIITAQEASPNINILTGVAFKNDDNSSKATAAKEYMNSLDISSKASIYKTLIASSNSVNTSIDMDEEKMAKGLDQWLSSNTNEEILVKFYDQYMSNTSYEDNLKSFGKVSYDAPSTIDIYVDHFDDKEKITDCIDKYNKKVSKDNVITYTDYIGMLTSSITTIINGISYVLIAFVAISLVVSCIMIGIITHISVMERTKEIGILRALGASKRNISQVFNAETFIIGCCSGILGIIISLILIIPINSIIQSLSGISDMSAQLSLPATLILILISIIITTIGGLFPAKKAAKKDPVIALRSE